MRVVGSSLLYYFNFGILILFGVVKVQKYIVIVTVFRVLYKCFVKNITKNM